jgi:fructose 1,6-bisphosphate aldolase/phosphatase
MAFLLGGTAELALSAQSVRRRAQHKAIEMRSQGWSGAAMLPYSELEYGGFRDTVSALLKRFQVRKERKPEAAE